MKDASEDEQEEDLVVPASTRSKQEGERMSKRQREEELRRMMDAEGNNDSWFVRWLSTMNLTKSQKKSQMSQPSQMTRRNKKWIQRHSPKAIS